MVREVLAGLAKAPSGSDIVVSESGARRVYCSARRPLHNFKGLFRGAVFHHVGRGARKQPPFTLLGCFLSLMGSLTTLMCRFPKCPSGTVSLSKIPWKTAHSEKAHLEVLEVILLWFCGCEKRVQKCLTSFELHFRSTTLERQIVLW